MDFAGNAGLRENEIPSRVGGHQWIAAFECGPPRVIHDSVLIGDIIYVFGGCRLDNLDEEHEPIEILTVSTLTFKWKILEATRQPPTDVPFMRYGHAVAEYKGRAYLFGGRSSFRFCNELFRYDPVMHLWQKIQTTGCVPNQLLGHSMNVVNDVAYVYGGLDNALNVSKGDMYALNFKNHQWSLVQQEGELPLHRYYHTACLIDRKIYVFGGQTRRKSQGDGDISHCDKIYYFDTDSLTWHRPEQRGLIPSGRRSHSGFVYEGRMYIHGGHSDRREECYGDMYRFNPQNGEWEIFPIHVGAVEIPPSRRSHTIVLAGDLAFMIGGLTIVQIEKDPEEGGGLEDEVKNWDEGFHHGDNNLYVLDMKPSLKTMTMSKVIQYDLDRLTLPRTLQTFMSNMFTLRDVKRTPRRREQ